MKKKLDEKYDIQDISKALVEVGEIRSVIWEYVGEQDFKKTLKKVKEGSLEDFRAEVIYGLIEDCIHEGGWEVGSFGIYSRDVDHPVEMVIYEYCGIYYIEGMYLDPIGYFYSKEAAASFGSKQWNKDKKTQDWREDLP
jgi:hypothetical protein